MGQSEESIIEGTGPGPETFLTIQAHPVTRVYCTGYGIIAFERHMTGPMYLDPASCSTSRKSALQRVNAILEPFHGNENDIMRKMPISDSGFGLTYNDIRNQTLQACKQSKQIEKELAYKAEEKRKRYKL